MLVANFLNSLFNPDLKDRVNLKEGEIFMVKNKWIKHHHHCHNLLPPPTNIILTPPTLSPQPQPPISTPTPPAESALSIISTPPTPSRIPPASLTPPPSSSLPASSPAPPSPSIPSNPPSSTSTRITRPASSPPPPSIRPPALSPPHSSTLPPALSPPPPVQNPKPPPAPRSPGIHLPEPLKALQVPPKNSPPSPVALPPSDNDTTTSSNSTADRSKAAGDGGIGTQRNRLQMASYLMVLFLGIIGAAGWCIWKRKKKDSGLSGGYILPANLVSSTKSGSASLKVPESTREIGNGGGSNIAHAPGNTGGLGHSKPWFTYQELLEATNEFSEHNLLGRRIWFCIQGCLDDGRDVAVKLVSVEPGSGSSELRLKSLADTSSTLGFTCGIAQERPVMGWAARVKIAVGAARGIAYLHEDFGLPVTNEFYPIRNILNRLGKAVLASSTEIESSNILLDNFDARVADFGLAKLAQDAKSHVTTRVMGTFGYMAPEYASSGKLTEKSDRPNHVSCAEINQLAFRLEAKLKQARSLLGHALEKEFVISWQIWQEESLTVRCSRMIRGAAACVRHSAAKRPAMGQIMRAFDSMLMSDLINWDEISPTIHLMTNCDFVTFGGTGGHERYSINTFSIDQLKQLKEIFKRFDLDHDGSLTQLELAALLRALGLKPHGDQINVLLANMDHNGNGFIEFDELVNAIMPGKDSEILINQEQLMEVFRSFDRMVMNTSAAELAGSMAKWVAR
ncbi:hypothetical protein HAX54_017464 [Datura stramonium]|uniref:non-specific serine/threonine protein kinase n=1 Tax=Datura stramonium TaxID=4076 RepID=A0ABS8UKW7_DATST|nr:hypothetical protein [Datura stramonium]